MQCLLRKLLLLVSLALTATAAGGTELSARLGSDHHVLLVRHAHAPGVGDPPGYSLERCETQRVLDDEGRRQATRIGQWLRSQGVARADVRSSPWCRCRQTAELLDLGEVTVEPALASFFDQPGQASGRNADLQRLVAGALRAKGSRALILVTHHVNIREFTGTNVGSGDLVLARVDARGRMIDHQVFRSP